MDRLSSPIEREINSNYWNEVYRDYALIQAVREIAVQLQLINANLERMLEKSANG